MSEFSDAIDPVVDLRTTSSAGDRLNGWVRFLRFFEIFFASSLDR